MTNTEAAAKFDEAIAQMTDPDQIARAELVREYFTNDAFRLAMAAEVAARLEAEDRSEGVE